MYQKIKKITIIICLVIQTFCLSQPYHITAPVAAANPAVVSPAPSANPTDKTSAGTFDPFTEIQFGTEGVDVGRVNSDKIKETDLIDKYRNVLLFFLAIIVATAFTMMVYRFFKLSAAGDNEQERKKAIRGILLSGVAIAMMGSATIIIGILYNMLAK